MAVVLNILSSGVFHASILFLVASGLQLVFGVQKLFNLACGSFYALGAYLGITFVDAFTGGGGPVLLSFIPLLAAGLALGAMGPIVERGLLRFVYDRDESFQLLLTFSVVLMFEDVIRFFWGTYPRSPKGVYLAFGTLHVGGATVPVYNLLVIGASLLIAVSMGYMLGRTRFGRIIRATASNSEMAQALGIRSSVVYMKVFTLGTVLGTVGGALVVPTTAAVSEMAVHLIVLAFAVVVIGGLGSMKGAFVGAVLVGLLKSVSIALYPELEMMLIYLIVIGVLVVKPQGLFGGTS
ncbi:MAG: branched-chain amino acid ABC transporter permease [Thermodesulfobacteriota bacterium]